MCNQCLLDPKMDFIFKRIFGNEQEPEILIRFLNAVLEPHSFQKPYDPITSIQFKNTEIPKASIEDKYAVLDVKATTSKGETIDIEIQREDSSDMLRRSLYYLDEMFTEQMESGDEYEKLNRVVSIIIMNYHCKFIENDRFHNVYRFHNIATGEELTDLQELHYIELKKMIGCDEDDVLQLFLEFLKDPYSEIVQSKSSEIKELSKAKEKLSKLSRDPKTREEFNAREKALKDKNSALATATARGIAIGEERGIAIGEERGIAIGEERGIAIGEERGKAEGEAIGEYKAKIKLAKNMLDLLDDETIGKKFDLPVEEVRKLRETP